jgi:hypothetical protein
MLKKSRQKGQKIVSFATWSRTVGTLYNCSHKKRLRMTVYNSNNNETPQVVMITTVSKTLPIAPQAFQLPKIIPDLGIARKAASLLDDSHRNPPISLKVPYRRRTQFMISRNSRILIPRRLCYQKPVHNWFSLV